MNEINNLFLSSLKSRSILYVKSIFFAIMHEHELFITSEDKRHLGIALTLAGFFIYAICTVSLDIESKDKAIQTGTALYIGLTIFQLFMLIYFFPLCLLLKGKGFFKCSHPWLIIIRSLLSMTSVLFYSLARVRTGSIDNSMLYSTDGLWIVLILLALKVKLNKFAILGTGIGVVGIVFVYFFDINSDLIGGGFGVLSGISLAIVLFLTSYMIKRDPPLRIGLYQSIIGLILYAGVSICFGVKTGWAMPDMSFVITMMLTGYCFGLALFCWIEAFYYAEVYAIGAASLALPVFTETMKWLFVKEFASLPTIIGSLIITTAGILIIVSSFLKDKEVIGQ